MVRCKVEGCGFFIFDRGCKKVDRVVVIQFRDEHNNSIGTNVRWAIGEEKGDGKVGVVVD